MKKTITLLLIAILLLLPTTALAHGLNIYLVEPGVLKAEYEGGGFSPRMVFTLYNEKGEVVLEGPIDDNGEFHFDKSIEFTKAEVDDGMGHLATYVAGEGEKKEITKLPVVIGVFVVIGVIFFISSKRKKADS